MSKDNLINTITNRIYNKFSEKYGEQFKQTGLGLEQINKIVTTKLENSQVISKETIPIIINSLRLTIDKIISKKIDRLNNEDVITPETIKTIPVNPTIQINQSNLIKETKTIEQQLLELKNSKLNLVKEEKQETNHNIDTLSMNKEIFPLKDRDIDIKIQKEHNTKLNKQYINLVLNKNNKIITFNDNYECFINKQELLNNKMISKIKLKQCILENREEINNQPYLSLHIKEINSQFETSVSKTIFCYLDLYKKQNNYLYFDTKDKYIEFKTPISLNGFTLFIKDVNNDKIIINKVNTLEESDENEENQQEKNTIDINTHIVIEIEYCSRI
jgi:hypothetical protein